MKISITKKEWNIPAAHLKIFNKKKIESMLNAINLASSGSFYMGDYAHEKLIIDSPYSLILCGYPKELAKQEGFGFFNRIFEEKDWILKMNAAGYKAFFLLPISQRTKVVVSSEFPVITASGEKFILHHKLIPYKLDDNGNMWLGLCYTAISTSKKMKHRATYFNSETGERHHFVDDEFVLSNTEPIKQDEIQILKWMIKGVPDKQMCLLMNNMSLSNFKRKKKQLFDKLDVSTSAEAVHEAHLQGII